MPPAKPPPAYQRPIPSPSVTISYLGVQSREMDQRAPSLARLSEALQQDSGPAVAERARFVDGAGLENEVFVAYWFERRDFDGWFSSLQEWWTAPGRHVGEVGIWREVISVPTSRFENIFSSPTFSVGTGRLVPSAVGPIDTHGFWGSMRQRLAAAAADPLQRSRPMPHASSDLDATRGRRVTVEVPRNLAIIRSGQDTSNSSPIERAEYENRILPVLGAGMEYLMNHPVETGCVSSRFLEELDPSGRPTAGSFGLAMFLSLGDLENWASSHPTHLAIYHRFSEFAKQRGADLKLDLWHEVAVIEPEQALFEYVNCHSATGLLRLVS